MTVTVTPPWFAALNATAVDVINLDPTTMVPGGVIDPLPETTTWRTPVVVIVRTPG